MKTKLSSLISGRGCHQKSLKEMFTAFVKYYKIKFNIVIYQHSTNSFIKIENKRVQYLPKHDTLNLLYNLKIHEAKNMTYTSGVKEC